MAGPTRIGIAGSTGRLGSLALRLAQEADDLEPVELDVREGLDLDGLFADGRAPLAGSLSSLGTQLREVHRSVDAAYFRRKQAGRNVQWVQWNGGEESW